MTTPTPVDDDFGSDHFVQMCSLGAGFPAGDYYAIKVGVDEKTSADIFDWKKTHGKERAQKACRAGNPALKPAYRSLFEYLRQTDPQSYERAMNGDSNRDLLGNGKMQQKIKELRKAHRQSLAAEAATAEAAVTAAAATAEAAMAEAATAEAAMAEAATTEAATAEAATAEAAATEPTSATAAPGRSLAASNPLTNTFDDVEEPELIMGQQPTMNVSPTTFAAITEKAAKRAAQETAVAMSPLVAEATTKQMMPQVERTVHADGEMTRRSNKTEHEATRTNARGVVQALAKHLVDSAAAAKEEQGQRDTALFEALGMATGEATAGRAAAERAEAAAIEGRSEAAAGRANIEHAVVAAQRSKTGLASAGRAAIPSSPRLPSSVPQPPPRPPSARLPTTPAQLRSGMHPNKKVVPSAAVTSTSKPPSTNTNRQTAAAKQTSQPIASSALKQSAKPKPSSTPRPTPAATGKRAVTSSRLALSDKNGISPLPSTRDEHVVP